MGRNGKERPLSLVLHHRGLCWIVRLDPSNRCNVEQVHGNKPYTECHDMSCITVSILLFTKNVNYNGGDVCAWFIWQPSYQNEILAFRVSAKHGHIQTGRIMLRLRVYELTLMSGARGDGGGSSARRGVC